MHAEADLEPTKDAPTTPAGGGRYLVRLDGTVFHVEVPDFYGQIVPGHDIPPAVAELHVRNRRDDFREERPVAWVFRLFKNCGANTRS